MSLKSQQKLMKEISTLISQNLSYCYGEKESGPNGAKKEFLSKSASFLRALAKDLCFAEHSVKTNKAGIAVSGEVSLYGMWSDGNGIFFEITQPTDWINVFLYREIVNIKDYRGGNNQWLETVFFKNQDYKNVCDILLSLKQEGVKCHAA